MKKTIFLFLLAVTLLFNVTNEVLASEDVYQIDNFKIIVTSINENGVTGFTVEKTGGNPFVSTVTNDLEHYFITGVKQIEDYYVLYGYGFTNNSDTKYDSLIFVFDSAGNTILKDLRDYGSMENVIDVFYIDDIFIACTEKVNDVGFSYQFNSNYFTSYDLDFNYLDSVEISSKIYKLSSNEMYVLVGFDSIEYDVGIRSDLSLISKNELLNISEEQVFSETVTIEFINSATINNDYVENGVTIDYPGNYTLIYNNIEYNFVVSPLISGVVNKQIYNDSVIPSISSGNIILNNDIFIPGTVISSPGNYDLVVTGANNYSSEISFTITSNLTGVVNNNVYVEPKTLEFNGNGYLNNQFVESPYEVVEFGEYIFKIRGENNYLETYFFAIEDDAKETSFIDFVQRVDILVLVAVLISGGIILKKK